MRKRNLTKATVINNLVMGKSCKLGECRQSGNPLPKLEAVQAPLCHSGFLLQWRDVGHLLPHDPWCPNPWSTPCSEVHLFLCSPPQCAGSTARISHLKTHLSNISCPAQVNPIKITFVTHRCMTCGASPWLPSGPGLVSF